MSIFLTKLWLLLGEIWGVFLDNWVYLLGLFIFGAILDILATIDTQSVVKRHPFTSFWSSLLGGYLGMVIVVDIVREANIILTHESVFFFCLGGALGGSWMIVIDRHRRALKRRLQQQKKRDTMIQLVPDVQITKKEEVSNETNTHIE